MATPRHLGPLRFIAALALLGLVHCGPPESESQGPMMPLPMQPPPAQPAPAPIPQGLPAEPPPLGRLPTDVRPTHYNLVLEVNPDHDRLAGSVEIRIELDRPRDVIWLHGRGINAKQTSVRSEGGGVQAAQWVQVDTTGVGMLRLARPVGPGKATIHIDYDAPFGDRLEGVHKVSRGGKSYAFTQFEPTFARQSFPCFDDPGFKTPFDLTLFVPREDEAVGNTREVERTEAPNGLKRITFATTEKLPSYLVAFAVGPLDVVSAPPIPPNAVRKRPLPLRGVAVKGKGAELAYSLAHTGEIVAALEGYFGIEYPYDKLDLIAVPNQQGAMENPGAVTFSEWLLLVDEANAAVDQRRANASVMAHELAHQWFGDLVTMRWWDDTWLNEAFATWMATRIVAGLHPEFHPEISAYDRVQDAMGTDALVSARQIHQEVKDINDIHNAFDSITYLKGGGVLAMFEQWVGPDKFQQGIQSYLGARRFGSATSDDLLATLTATAGRDVATPFRTFLDQSGVPMVEASLRCGKTSALHLKQSRYVSLGSTADANRTWQIPVCARYTAGKKMRESCTLLTDKEGDLPLDLCPAWVMPNADAAGYYRWSLDAADARKLAAQGLGKLSVRERLSFGNSLRASFARGTTPGGEVLSELAPFATDATRSVATMPMNFWGGVTEWIDRDPLYPTAQAYERNLYAPVFRELGFAPKKAAGKDKAEDSERKLLRGSLVYLMTQEVNDPAARRDAAELGRAYVGMGKDGAIHPEAVDPNFAGTALAVAVQEGDAAFFDSLLAKLSTTDDENVRGRLLWALGSVRKPELAARARDLALDPRVRVHEVTTPIEAQLTQPETRDAAWEWFQQHVDALIGRLPPARASRVIGFGGHFCDMKHATELAALFGYRIGSLEGGPRILGNVLEGIQLCSARRDKQEAGVRAFFQKQPGAPAPAAGAAAPAAAGAASAAPAAPKPIVYKPGKGPKSPKGK